jgi:hypothetical protein
MAISEVLRDARRFRTDNVEVALGAGIGIFHDLLHAAGCFFALGFAKAFSRIEEVIVFLERAHGHEGDKRGRGCAYIHLVDDPRRIGFDSLVGVAEDPKG